ncbi:MAG: hypothetical protein SXA11_07435 [Cyanobacteriota bacterium]|nr:hypothetical protein [Cyanobacteriota bacterium]
MNELLTPDEVNQKREKCGGLEYVGPTGEYDEKGLAKRVVLALDDIDGLQEIEQEGSVIKITGNISPTAKKKITLVQGVTGLQTTERDPDPHDPDPSKPPSKTKDPHDPGPDRRRT